MRGKLGYQRNEKKKRGDKEAKPIAAVAIYCSVCGYYIIAKDSKVSTEHRMLLNDHIKTRHKDAKLNL